MSILRTLSTIARIIVILVAILWVGTFIAAIVKRVAKKEKFSLADLLPLSSLFEKPILIMVILLVVLGVFLYGDVTFNELVGIHRPLSERGGDCVCCYYVEVKGNKSNKEYTVPAEIYVEAWREEDSDGKTIGGVYYYIRKLCFDDGTVVYFDDYEQTSFKHFTTLYDEHGNEWRCKLTEKHAYSKNVQETSYLSAWSIIELVSFVSIFLFNAFGGLYLQLKDVSRGRFS